MSPADPVIELIARLVFVPCHVMLNALPMAALTAFKDWVLTIFFDLVVLARSTLWSNAPVEVFDHAKDRACRKLVVALECDRIGCASHILIREWSTAFRAADLLPAASFEVGSNPLFETMTASVDLMGALGAWRLGRKL